MTRLVGIETEYGIAVEGRGAGDLMQECIGVVRSYAGPHVTGWNYRGEDPRRDLRGFLVSRLATDDVDAQFDGPGAPRLSINEERSDRILANGARLYNDHGHPEYATPECSTIAELVAHDRAGERIVLECARRRAAQTGGAIAIYKNNTDYHGASYGAHEDYLLARSVPTDALIDTLTTFLVTRQVFAGAGKVGVEGSATVGPAYQLSQRADFASVVASVDTLSNRPIFNTRDEPHAPASRFRRLHVIIGDANMSEWATAMKVGTTACVLSLLEAGWACPIRLRDPVHAIKAVSRDRTLRWLVEMEDGSTMAAVDVQRVFLAEARRALAGSSPDADWVIAEWEAILNDLEGDLTRAADRVDWVIKRTLLDDFCEAEGIDMGDPVMRSLDLAYHDIDPERGLYAGWEQSGRARRIVSDEAVRAAMTFPPETTRAFIRGMFVRRFGPAIRSIGWNGIAFEYGGEDLLLDLGPLVDGAVLQRNADLAAAANLDDVVRALNPALVAAK